MRRRFVWDPATQDLVEASPRRAAALHFIQTDLPGYESPITGAWVEGRKARREDLRKHGCRPWEGREAEEKEAARGNAAKERALDQLAEKMAHKAWDIAPERVRKVFRSR